jgi:hypothetical protein
MLHDACKIDAYIYEPYYGVWEKNPEHPAGHGDLSLAVIEKLGIDLTDEERACIRWHMGAFDDRENWNGYTDAIHLYPNVLWTHVADMMATHIDEATPKGTTCCLCGGKIFSGYGNNPYPLSDSGICCDDCNTNKVIPERLRKQGVLVDEEGIEIEE